MIDKNKLESALIAFRDLAIEGRRMAYEKVDYRVFQEYFDKLEYLPSLILEKEDRTAMFKEYLKGICTEFNLPHIFRKYE